MGDQTASLADALGAALATVVKGRRALLVASTDLSHYHDAATAAALDAVVIRHLALRSRRTSARPGSLPRPRVRRRTDGRRDAGGPGPRRPHARVLRYADSGDVSGDKQSVVGYLAAALGNFTGATLASLP